MILLKITQLNYHQL